MVVGRGGVYVGSCTVIKQSDFSGVEKGERRVLRQAALLSIPHYWKMAELNRRSLNHYRLKRKIVPLLRLLNIGVPKRFMLS